MGEYRRDQRVMTEEENAASATGKSTTYRRPDLSSSRERSRERERRRRRAQADCIKRAGGFQKLADSEGHEPIRLFWDGFQWVAKTGEIATNNCDPALMNSTRKLRRLYFGNLPLHLGLTEQNFQDVVYQQMKERGHCKSKDKNPVLYVWFAKEKGNYGFVEFATVEETEKALTMDGMPCLGIPLKVSRPNDYTTASGNSSVAMAQMGIQAAAQLVIGHSGQPGDLPGPPPGACRCLRAVRMVGNMDSITATSEEYAEILEDVWQGFQAYGSLLGPVLMSNDLLPAVRGSQALAGDVYLVFKDAKEADQCYQAMSGRQYEGKKLTFERCTDATIENVVKPVLEHKELLEKQIEAKCNG